MGEWIDMVEFYWEEEQCEQRVWQELRSEREKQQGSWGQRGQVAVSQTCAGKELRFYPMSDPVIFM